MKFDNVNLFVSAVRRSQYPDDELPEFIMLGRSNVGKSSFMNTIVNRKNLARISSRPGKTSTLNFYNVDNKFYLVDVPGYGFARVQKSLKKKFGMIIEEYLESRENLEMVFMLVDFRHKPTEDDVLMYNYLRHYNIPVTIIATKVDKVNRSAQDKNKKIILKTLNMENEEDLILFSTITKIGKSEAMEKIEKYLV